MITYELIKKRSISPLELIGMSLRDFDLLFNKFDSNCKQNAYRELGQSDPGDVHRKKGRPYQLDTRNRLLMTLLWLQNNVTFTVLAQIYKLTPLTVSKHVRATLKILESMPEYHKILRSMNRRPWKIVSIDALLDLFPELQDVMRGLAEVTQD